MHRRSSPTAIGRLMSMVQLLSQDSLHVLLGVLPFGFTINSSIGVNDPTRHFEHARRTHSALRRSHAYSHTLTRKRVRHAAQLSKATPQDRNHGSIVTRISLRTQIMRQSSRPHESKGSSSKDDQTRGKRWPLTVDLRLTATLQGPSFISVRGDSNTTRTKALTAVYGG
jgi:hypothetical protein